MTGYSNNKRVGAFNILATKPVANVSVQKNPVFFKFVLSPYICSIYLCIVT
jgi:hypothetical protein